MIHYIVVRPDGLIHEAASVQEQVISSVEVAPEYELKIVPEPVDPERNFWDGVSAKPLPERPYPWSVFDAATETWGDPTAPETLSQLQGLAVERINREAGRARTHFATDIPFQGSLYGEKRDEARKYVAAIPEPADLTGFPLMAKEVGKTAPTAMELAQVWLQLGDLWVSVLADIEGIRTDRFIEIDAATTATEIETAVELAFADLSALMGNT